jgi:hypothetical protein
MDLFVTRYCGIFMYLSFCSAQRLFHNCDRQKKARGT